MAYLTKDIVKKALYNDIDAQYAVGCWFYENQTVEYAYFWSAMAAQQGHFEAALVLKKLSSNQS